MKTIWAIPGFLGLPRDWEVLEWTGLNGVDLYRYPWQSMQEWAARFNAEVEAAHHTGNILVGYSLGGRLALHALLGNEHLWDAAVIVSANSGLATEEQRKQRRLHDQTWAHRFEKEEWISLMREWNGQEVFAGDSFHFDRQEKDYQRSTLAQQLVCGSLGRQDDLKEAIEKFTIPLLWMTGADDLRFCQVAGKLKFSHPQSRWNKIPEAGHRVPWAQPEAFKTAVRTFIESIDR